MSDPPEWYTPLPSKEEVVEVLRTARALLNERGWTQRTPVDRDGRLCLATAIGFAAEKGTEDISERVYRRMDAEFVLQRRLAASSLVHWNDQPGRTSEQVLDALEGAAQQVETSSKPGRDAIYNSGRADVRR